jgi:hypothetical protein
MSFDCKKIVDASLVNIGLARLARVRSRALLQHSVRWRRMARSNDAGMTASLDR